MAHGVHESRTLSVSVERSPEVVYAFTSDPRNLPRWSFFESVEPAADRWLASTPSGRVLLRFVDANAVGRGVRSGRAGGRPGPRRSQGGAGGCAAALTPGASCGLRVVSTVRTTYRLQEGDR